MARLSARAIERLHLSRFGRVAPWMRQLFAVASRPGLEVAAVSMGRGGAKTTAAASVAAATMIHESNRGSGGDVVVFASSFEQAKLAGRDAAMLLPRGEVWAHRSSGQRFEVEHRPSGSRLRVLGSDAARSMGQRPRLVLLDEPASWKPGGWELWQASRTALGKIDDGRVILLGTRPYDPGHWWERLLSDPPAASEVLVWSADPDADPLDRREWHRANPSLRTLGLPKVDTLANEAADAADDPAALATFRALRLNSGTPLASAGVLIDPDVWSQLPTTAERAGPLIMGIDLGAAASLSAAVGYWPLSGRLEAVAAVGDIPALRSRGRAMGVPGFFERAEAVGDLLVTSGRNPSIDQLLDVATRRWGAPDVVVADTFRSSELADVLDRVDWARWGAPDVVIRSSKERTEDLVRAQKRINAHRVAPVRSELLDRSVAAARTKVGPDGRSRLVHSSTSIDDVAAAMVLAVASGDRAFPG